MTQKQIRRSYSNEFKRNAVALSEHPGRQVNEVAEKLGITEQILTRWRREHRRRGELSFPGNGRQAFNKEQTRIRELRSNCALSRWSETSLKKQWPFSVVNRETL